MVRSEEDRLEKAPDLLSDPIRLPNIDADEDGFCHLADIELCGAHPVLLDRNSGLPVLVRHAVGKGFVYLLCTYAYPGHEALRELMPRVLLRLNDLHASKRLTVSGDCCDVYWSVWGTNGRADKVYLLNTDWTREENEKRLAVHTPSAEISLSVREGSMREITLFEGGFLWADNPGASITWIGSSNDHVDYQVCAVEDTVLRFSADRPVIVTVNGESRKISGETEWGLSFSHAEPISLRIELPSSLLLLN